MVQTQLAFDHLTQSSQKIWRATTFERMLTQLMDVGQESCGVVQAQMFELSVKESLVQISPVDLDLEIEGFSKELNEQAAEIFKSLPLKNHELRSGFHVIALDHQNIEFAIFGDPAADWHLLAWQRNKAPQSHEGLDADKVWDFLISQVQSGSVWCRRLDKTQALLHLDDLTGLFNHRYLDSALVSEIRRAERFQAPFAIMFIDLDNFKPINDTYGHLSGSGVLKQFADVLRDALREVDSVARYGGDEFVVMLLGASTAVATLVAERLRKQVAEHDFTAEHGEVVKLTCSIGLASFPQHGRDKESLLRKADESMYVSKRTGKNRVTSADELSKHVGLGEVYATSRFEQE